MVAKVMWSVRKLVDLDCLDKPVGVNAGGSTDLCSPVQIRDFSKMLSEGFFEARHWVLANTAPNGCQR